MAAWSGPSYEEKKAASKGRRASLAVMKAIRLHTSGGPEALVYEEAPEPRPQAGEVLVRVQATAITPTEFEWSPTWRTVRSRVSRLTLRCPRTFF